MRKHIARERRRTWIVRTKMTEGKAFVILIASAAVILLGALVIKSPTVVNLLFAGLVASFLAMFWGNKMGKHTGRYFGIRQKDVSGNFNSYFCRYDGWSLDSVRNRCLT